MFDPETESFKISIDPSAYAAARGYAGIRPLAFTNRSADLSCGQNDS